MEGREREWSKFMEETQRSQEAVGELSKLYIVLHEQVRSTILKCTLDLTFDPTPQANAHLTRILDLLHRLSDPNDQYLRSIDPAIPNKFQQQLLDLAQQLQKLLQTYRAASTIDPSQLARIVNPRRQPPHGLKDELKRSEQRRLRSRSGKTRPAVSSGSVEVVDKIEAYRSTYLQKQSKMAKEMQGHVQKRSNQVIFANKYAGSNLEEYFTLRRDLVDLVTVEQHTRQLLDAPRQQPDEGRTAQEAVDPKLFPDFKIKTKFMKQRVRENILAAVAEAKLQLLEDYHARNTATLSKGNPDSLIVLVAKDHPRTSTAVPAHSHSLLPNPALTAPNFRPRARSQPHIQPPPTARYPNAHRQRRPLIYEAGWSVGAEEAGRAMLALRLKEGRVPN